MKSLECFQEMKKIVKQSENYIPRNYKTIGGMWTIDCWQLNGVVYQMMDEGWFEQIVFEGNKIISLNHENKIGYRNTSEVEFTLFAVNFIINN